MKLRTSKLIKPKQSLPYRFWNVLAQLIYTLREFLEGLEDKANMEAGKHWKEW